MSADQVEVFVQQYGMLPHPEGGYYIETWRSDKESELISESGQAYTRSRATSIIFLLPGNTFSALHRIRSEELWNYHFGDPVIIYEIIDGQWKETILGPGRDQKLQHVVNPGVWFASRCSSANGFSICGCTVVPGFDFDDFEMSGKASLCAEYPELSQRIIPLTRIP